ncbi:MAG: dihydrodipicolinate synthase family protein [Thermoplasmata archaeon]|nr:dihydrodipicolinate synthase family protein [Thermoplasmata archaeon]
MRRVWRGVLPAVTTPFGSDLSVDLDAFARHCRWLTDRGCSGVIVLGSLGEGGVLDPSEKGAVVETAVRALDGRRPVIAAVAALRTSDAVAFARRAVVAGASGLLVLPPYVYRGDWRETREHFSAVLRSTNLPCMLYNNPVAYGTDVLPNQLLDLASEHPTLRAVKESSMDVRRFTAIRALLGERVDIAVGVDDEILEGIDGGATSWVAGLANAFPAESVELFRRATDGHRAPALELYRWFLPLLRMDSSPKFVQLIKLLQAEMGLGNARVRPPRLELEGDERAHALESLRSALGTRPIGFPSM